MTPRVVAGVAVLSLAFSSSALGAESAVATSAGSAAIVRAPEFAGGGTTLDSIHGIADVATLELEEPGTLRLAAGAGYFSQSSFGGTTVRLTGLGSSIAVGWSPMDRLSIGISGRASSHEGAGMLPRTIQALGDLDAIVVWSPIRYRSFAGGLQGGVRAYSGSSALDGYAKSLSPSLDVAGAASIGPSRIAFLEGIVIDRSEAIVPGGAVLTPPQRTAYGAADGSAIRGAVVTSLPLGGGRVEPFVALHTWSWMGGAKGARAAIGSAGVRMTPRTRGRAVTLDIAGDVRLMKEDAAKKVPLDPAWRVTGLISMTLPPWHASSGGGAPVVQRVEVPVAAPPTTGEITGTVRDGRSGEPLAFVIVDVPNVTENAMLTDASGIYRLKGIPPGAARVRIQKQGYAITTLDVTVAVGASATADATLEPGAARPTGVFSGDVHGRDGKAIAAKITFVFGKDSRSILADAGGKFQVTLPPGKFEIKVEAPGYLSQSKALTIAAGEQTVFNFVLSAAAP